MMLTPYVVHSSVTCGRNATIINIPLIVTLTKHNFFIPVICKGNQNLGNRGTFMGPKTKLLLLSSAASMIVVTATGRWAQAADMPVIKAAPVDYVERCTQYG